MRRTAVSPPAAGRLGASAASGHTARRKTTYTPRRQERFPFQRWTSVNLGGGGEGRMCSRSRNHLRVNSFCDTLRPGWWMSHGTREVADVSVIITCPPGTLAAIAQPKKERKKKTVWFPVKGDIRRFFFPLFFLFFNQPRQQEPCCQLTRNAEVSDLNCGADTDLIDIPVSWIQNDEI